MSYAPRESGQTTTYPESARCPTGDLRALSDHSGMALITISEWIERFGTFDGSGQLRPPTLERRTDCVQRSADNRRNASARVGLPAFMKDTSRTSLRLNLRRG